MKAAVLSAVDSLLILWSDYPGVFMAFAMVCICVAFRFAFMAGFKVVQKPSPREQQQNAQIALTVAQGQPTAKTRKVKAIVQMSDYRERKGA